MRSTPRPQALVKHCAITSRLTPEHFEEIAKRAHAIGLTPSEWTRQQLVTILTSPEVPPPLGVQHAQLFLQELLCLQALIQDSLERSMPDARAITTTKLRALLEGLDQEKSANARSLLVHLSSRPPLPIKKG